MSGYGFTKASTHICLRYATEKLRILVTLCKIHVLLLGYHPIVLKNFQISFFINLRGV